MRTWDDFDASSVDDESTKLTDYARTFATASASAETEGAYLWAAGGSVTRILAHGYLTEVRGSSSANGHGKQGCWPRRVAELRAYSEEYDVPVRIVFIDERAEFSDRQKWQAVWLDRIEPEVVNIDNDTTHRRQGWRVAEMIRGQGLIDFPEEAPPRRVPEGLFG